MIENRYAQCGIFAEILSGEDRSIAISKVKSELGRYWDHDNTYKYGDKSFVAARFSYCAIGEERCEISNSELEKIKDFSTKSGRTVFWASTESKTCKIIRLVPITELGGL